ncbi:MAG: DNA repair protein RadA [Crocinitomicaceae bacterium]|nr:DNA repair protein RadA [Crocinitomicaceae bacterium]|tara:strand:- start:3432 stop:4793 length:1362 start_codon:yes stop_codon:yes gene_type:complete
MGKIKSTFVCQNCGAKSSKWIGKCPSCQQWNTFSEEVIKQTSSIEKLISNSTTKQSKPMLLQDVQPISNNRIHFSDKEFNRVLGGGLVYGSVVLIGGEPGIGKSTLTLKIALNSNCKCLYVSGEESDQQIKLRANRLKGKMENCYLLQETQLQQIIHQANQLNPDFIVLDSIQTLQSETIDSSAGSISQIKECTAQIVQFAKASHIPILLIGHINKEGSIAGPKVLEHMVDTVLQFEGDHHHVYRIIRSIKNRFGSTNEIGIYEMLASGLIEVQNPSKILINNHKELLSGVSIAASLEGIRPILIEIQALTSSAAYGTPQRSSTGFDLRRLNMLLAVLEKRCGFKIAAKDVFLNITGGIKVNDPAIDLGVVCAILSSNFDLHIPSTICFIGEVGLSGEIRPVPRIDQRISEAQKMGFKTVFLSKYISDLDINLTKIKLVKVGKIQEVMLHLFN